MTKLTSRKTRKGLLAGVQLQPEGLDLLKPATVRFTRRGKGAKGTRIVFVGTRGTGRDLYRLPPPVRSKGHGKTRRFTPTGRPVVTITHFSTVDAFDWSTATVADLDAILYPELGVDRLSQEIARLLKDPKTTEQDLVDAYEREYKRFIDPLLKVASARLRTSCSVPAIRGAIVAPVLALAVYSPRTITIPPGGSISENTLVQIVRYPAAGAAAPPGGVTHSIAHSWTGALACISSR